MSLDKKLNIKIRKATLKDLNEILKIGKVSFKSNFWSKEALFKFFKNFPESFLIAQINNKIVGYIFGKIRKGKIHSIAVSPKWRKKGIGTLLLKEYLSLSKNLKIKKITLHVRESNFAGVSFYKKNKFKVLKKIEKYYPDGETAFLMEITLF